MEKREPKSVVMWVRVSERHAKLVEKQMKVYGYKCRAPFFEKLIDSLEAERLQHDRKSRKVSKRH